MPILRSVKDQATGGSRLAIEFDSPEQRERFINEFTIEAANRKIDVSGMFQTEGNNNLYIRLSKGQGTLGSYCATHQGDSDSKFLSSVHDQLAVAFRNDNLARIFKEKLGIGDAAYIAHGSGALYFDIQKMPYAPSDQAIYTQGSGPSAPLPSAPLKPPPSHQPPPPQPKAPAGGPQPPTELGAAWDYWVLSPLNEAKNRLYASVRWEQGAGEGINVRGAQGETLLHKACYELNAPAIARLLDLGVDQRERDNDGRSAFGILAFWLKNEQGSFENFQQQLRGLDQIAQKRILQGLHQVDRYLVQQLMSGLASPPSPQDYVYAAPPQQEVPPPQRKQGVWLGPFGWGQVQNADLYLEAVFNRLYNGSSQENQALIAWYGGIDNVRGSYGQTLLHKACDEGNARAIAFFLQWRADPQATDSRGVTPFGRLAVTLQDPNNMANFEKQFRQMGQSEQALIVDRLSAVAPQQAQRLQNGLAPQPVFTPMQQWHAQEQRREANTPLQGTSPSTPPKEKGPGQTGGPRW